MARNFFRDPTEIIESDRVGNIVLYKRTPKVMIYDGLLRKEDELYFARVLPSALQLYVDVSRRLVVAASDSIWDSKKLVYLNEDYFYSQPDLFEILEVEGMANFPDCLLLCRSKVDGNRLWTKQTNSTYYMNSDYYPNERSRQARVIEVMADLDNPLEAVPEPDLEATEGSLESLMSTKEFMEQIDEALQKNH